MDTTTQLQHPRSVRAIQKVSHIWTIKLPFFWQWYFLCHDINIWKSLYYITVHVIHSLYISHFSFVFKLYTAFIFVYIWPPRAMIYGELELFLTGLGLNHLVQLFQEQQVDFDMFLRMTDEDFIKVNLHYISSMTKKNTYESLMYELTKSLYTVIILMIFSKKKNYRTLKKMKKNHLGKTSNRHIFWKIN